MIYLAPCAGFDYDGWWAEVSIISTSPDFVQSLDFLVSRFLSGTRLESGLGLDKNRKIFFSFVQSLSRQESVLDLDQIKNRFESGLSLDKTQKYFWILSRPSPDSSLVPDNYLDREYIKLEIAVVKQRSWNVLTKTRFESGPSLDKI